MSFSSNHVSVHEIFRIANRIENPSLGDEPYIVMVQPDTSYLDEVATLQDTHRRKRKIKTLESDEDKLRKISLKIIDPDIYRRAKLQHPFSSKTTTVNNNCQIRKGYTDEDLLTVNEIERGIEYNPPLASIIPRLNWEQEVRIVMESHDANTLNKLLAKTCFADPYTTLIFPLQSVNPTSFHCFEPEYVNMNEILHDDSDPLKRLIPNPTEETQVGITLDKLLKKVHSHAKLFDKFEDLFHFDAREIEALDDDDNDNDNEVSTAVAVAAAAAPLVPSSLVLPALFDSATASMFDDNNTSSASQAPAALTKEQREKQMMKEKIKRLSSVGIGREAAEAILLRKQFGKRAISQYGGDIPTVRTRRASVIASVNHSTAATTNRNVKMDLSEFEFYHFHRPRLPKSMLRSTSSNSTSNQSGTSNATMVGTSSSSSSSSSSNSNSTAITTPKIWQVYVNSDYYQIKPLSSAALTKHFGRMNKHSNISDAGSHQEYLNSLSLDRRKHMQTKPSLHSETEKQNLSIQQGEVICIEYIEENLPVYLHHGMASAILNYFRLPQDKSQGEDYEAMQQKDKAQALEQAILSSCNRIPRFLNLLLTSQEQKNMNETSYLNSNIDVPKLFYGETKVLRKDDESPFLGDIDELELQPSISNTLFKAPLFEHRPQPNDYLLIRSKQPTSQSSLASATDTTTVANAPTSVTKPVNDPATANDVSKDKDKDKDKDKNKIMYFCLREMNSLFLCGQLEPLKIVPRPNNKFITKLQEKMILLSAARYFRSVGGYQSGGEGVNFNEVVDGILKYGRNKPNFNLVNLKKVLKDRITEEVTGNNGQKRWYLKENYYTPAAAAAASGGPGRKPSGSGAGMTASRSVRFSDGDIESPRGGSNEVNDEQLNLEMQRQYSVEELERSLLPEEVCLQHTCNAYEVKLNELGISDIELYRIKTWLERMQRNKDFKISRAAHLKLALLQITTSTAANNRNILISNPKYFETHVEYQQFTRLLNLCYEDIKLLEEKIEIAQFVYEKLIIAPWNTTETYVRSHIERDGQGVMEINGQGHFLGDPSGKGEGYAYVRSIRYETTSGKKTPQAKLVSTDKDLRKLTRGDLHKLLRGFGVTESEFKDLKRWDMVDLVRMHSTKAERSGISTALHKYARGGVIQATDRLSGKKESFQEVADRIWRKQKLALSAGAVSSHNGLATGGGGSSSGGVNGSKSKDVEDEENDDHDDDDDDDWNLEGELGLVKDIENTVARRANELQIELDKKKKLEEQSKRNEEALELRAMRAEMKHGKPMNIFASSHIDSDIAISSIAAKSTSSSSSSSSASTSVTEVSVMNARNEYFLQQQKNIPRPKKVVKKTARRIHEDGTEIIEVSYILSTVEVDRVNREAERKMQEDELLSRSTGLLLKSNRAGQIDTDEATLTKVLPNSLKMKFKVGANTKATAAALAAAAKHNANQSAVDGDIHYKPRLGSTARLGAVTMTQWRMPHVHFASKLENEFMKIWRKKTSEAFRYPVPREIEGYHEMIKNPISLSDILNKIVSYQYYTVQAVIDDMELMMTNAETFNAPGSQIAIEAKGLYKDLKVALTHDLNTLGREKDEFTLLEQAIAKKFSFWHRDTTGGKTSSNSASTAAGSTTSSTSNKASSSKSNVVANPVNSTVAANKNPRKKISKKKVDLNDHGTSGTSTSVGTSDPLLDPLESYPQQDGDGDGLNEGFNYAEGGDTGELDLGYLDDMGFDFS